MTIRYRVSLVLLTIAPQAFLSCSGKEEFNYTEWREKLESMTPERVKVVRTFSLNDTTDYDWPADSLLNHCYSGEETALRRARQLVDLKWTPFLDVPSCYGVYSKEEHRGAPYSLAYMTNTQLGTQVSIHTFMTALQNPYSVLYTENLRNYGGSTDSAPFYGSTCSNSVMYVLGIEPPYYTRMFGVIPGMKKTKDQSPDSIELCDVLWKTGHVMMVYDIERNAENDITRVSLFETSTYNAKDTWIKEYSYDAFLSYWEKSKMIRYKYEYLDQNTDYTTSVFVPLEDESSFDFQYNYDICPTLGDRCSYLEGQDVRLAVLSDYFSEIVVYKDGSFYKRVTAERPITTLAHLPYGEYRICMAKEDRRSGFAHFEVINAVSESSVDSQIHVHFSSNNSSPRYISISDADRHPYNFYEISAEGRTSNMFEMKKINSAAATHYQVYFKGRYGVVATELKELK